ncbi:hypothetical protein AMR76_10065 [Vibrio furnissii]|uniref:Type I restriction modification DNA specificity domain-containing protein n=1 Tax=Vibrio furnissii TaxID=29494 RepID=A0A0Q2Y135_VIBFU|nr:restriction endonuclease subunit S [Vibrio furnissii]KQH86364.1 hypothetical protein AMR76_10065 [Vibrio furnissii]
MGKYQVYSSYRESALPWMGKVPSHWIEKKFKRAFVEKKKKPNNDLPAGSISFGEVIRKKEDNLSPETKASYQEVLEGEFLLNPLNLNFDLKSLRTALSEIDVVVSTGYIVLNGDPAFNQRYLRWLLFLFDVAHMKTLGSGVRQTINFPEIGSCEFFHPEHLEQTQIANFLDHETAKIDTLIEKQQQLIKLLKEKRQAVISHAVTKGLNPQAPMKDSGVEWLGEVPEHWKLTLFKYLVSQMGGGTPDKGNTSFWNGDIPWVSPKDMKVDYISTSQDLITDIAVKNSSTKLVPEQSILMVVRGMILIHSVPVALTTKPVTINQDMKALIPNKDIQPEFLLFFLKGIKDYILDFVETSAHGTKCLRTEDFENMQLFIPPIDEQVAILSSIKTSLDKLDSLIQIAEQAITLMSERRTALISAAVTGKIDVREWRAH